MKAVIVDNDVNELNRLEVCLQDAFGDRDVELVRFADPLLAIEYMALHKEDILYIFTALLLHPIDGLNFSKRCRKLLPAVPVFISGFTDGWEIGRLAYANGAVEYFARPVNAKAVWDATRNL